MDFTTWRKSTYSGGNGDCVEVARLNIAAWRKSTRSSANGACVEVARLEAAIGLRDSKNPRPGISPSRPRPSPPS